MTQAGRSLRFTRILQGWKQPSTPRARHSVGLLRSELSRWRDFGGLPGTDSLANSLGTWTTDAGDKTNRHSSSRRWSSEAMWMTRITRMPLGLATSEVVTTLAGDARVGASQFGGRPRMDIYHSGALAEEPRRGPRRTRLSAAAVELSKFSAYDRAGSPSRSTIDAAARRGTGWTEVILHRRGDVTSQQVERRWLCRGKR